MGKKVLISEQMENELINFVLNENKYYPNPDKVLVIKNYLDTNFVRTNVPDVASNGMPIQKTAVGMKDSNGQVINTLSTNDLFFMLQEKFKNIEGDRNERDKFLKQIIKDWINKKISREGGLSVNFI